MDSRKRRVKGLVGIILCLCMLWGSVMTVYAKDYTVDYVGDPHIKIGIGTILYAGDTIMQKQGASGGFAIAYENINGSELDRSALAGADNSNEPARTVQVKPAESGYDGWKVIRDTEYDDRSGTAGTIFKIEVQPYKLPTPPVIDSEPTNIIEEQPSEPIDRDTFKSDYPAGTVTGYTGSGTGKMMDFKVHATEQKNVNNQQILADYYMSSLGFAGAKSVLSKDIFPYRALDSNEKGIKMPLQWKLNDVAPGTTVYAICYNQTDGAYMLNGTVGQDGVAVFDQFILREATTVSLVVPR